MTAPLLAHVGHWIWQVMPLLPILVVVVSVWIARRRDPDREERLEREAEEARRRELEDIFQS
ncbi:MAG TPA: hypothetical protein VKA89_05665 [Solirubrobacterales bacterium]|nr:hypothetical protein [Solirubrobacterales bacterium]